MSNCREEVDAYEQAAAAFVLPHRSLAGPSYSHQEWVVVHATPGYKAAVAVRAVRSDVRQVHHVRGSRARHQRGCERTATMSAGPGVQIVRKCAVVAGMSSQSYLHAPQRAVATALLLHVDSDHIVRPLLRPRALPPARVPP